MDEGGTEVALEREVALVLLKIRYVQIIVDIDQSWVSSDLEFFPYLN